jgi:hypothetical protein
MQVIIIDSVEALAIQIERELIKHSCDAPVVDSILSCLHPIEVPNEAGELVHEVVNEMESPFDTKENREAKAAALITARDAAIRAGIDKIECERDHLIEAAKRYMKAYGPGYSTTDTLAYDALTGALAAICRKEVVG